jgi:hypothetical protein
MSTLPHFFIVASTRRLRSSFSEMLQGTAMAASGCFALISFATFSHASALRLDTTTLAPCSA